MDKSNELPPVAEEKTSETKESQQKPTSQKDHQFTDWALI